MEWPVGRCSVLVVDPTLVWTMLTSQSSFPVGIGSKPLSSVLPTCVLLSICVCFIVTQKREWLHIFSFRYSIILSCWFHKACERPTFSQLVEFLNRCLETESCPGQQQQQEQEEQEADRPYFVLEVTNTSSNPSGLVSDFHPDHLLRTCSNDDYWLQNQ